MRKHKLLTLLATTCAVLLAFGNNANALTLGDEKDLGQILPASPSGDQDRTDYVNHLISLAPNTTGDTFQGQTFDRSFVNAGPGFPNYPTAVFDHNGTGTSVDLGNGTLFSYLFVKYDDTTGGAEVWYVGGLSGTVTIPDAGPLGHEFPLSDWTLFGPGATNTPDGGTSAALFGLGLASLAGLRARFGRG
jgi:hypothetical protein